MTIILETIYMKYIFDIPYLPLMDQYSIRDSFLDADLFRIMELKHIQWQTMYRKLTLQSNHTEHHELNNQAKPPTTNKNLIKIKN